MLRAVLFDLDDTLSDHTGSARAGLRAWREHYPALQASTPDELERMHSEHLEAAHVRMLAGELTKDEARALRTRQLFAHHGVELGHDEVQHAYARYRDAYDAAGGLVPGCRPVLHALRARHGLRLAVVTNNLEREQVEKLDRLSLADSFDVVVISEAVGLSKPDPRIFHLALERLAVGPEEAVMVGDSPTTDLAGAAAAGVRAVWFDRRGEATPASADGVLRSWEPPEAAIDVILGRA